MSFAKRDLTPRRSWMVAVILSVAWPLALPAEEGTPPASASSTPPAAQQEQKPPPQAPAAPKTAPAQKPATAGATTLLPGQNRLFFEWRYTLNGSDLKGNKDRSFLHEGTNHITEFTSFFAQPIWGVRQFESTMVFRYTDDPRVDVERNSLQRGYARLKGPTFEANLGDYLASYSRFAFNQNIKGLNVWKQFSGPGLRLTGTGGTFTDRWGALFREFTKFTESGREPDPKFPSKPFTRVVLGARAEKRIDESSFVAFSYSQGSDVIRSLPRETLLRPLNNQLVSVDATGRLGQSFQLAGELAFSRTQFDARIQHQKRNDYAARVEASHRWKRLDWRFDYARFLPNFFSVNARQVQDLQDISARANLELSSRMTLSGSFRRTNDNLPGRPVVVADPLGTPIVLTNRARTQGTGTALTVFDQIVDSTGNKLTTVVRSPELRLAIRRLPPSQRLQISLGYRERGIETSNRGSFDLADPANRRALFLDRNTRMPFIDLELPFTGTIFGLSYEYRRNRDRVLRENSTFTHRMAASYRGTYFWGAWTVSPSLRFETERELKHLPLRDLLLTLDGRDQTRSIQGSLIIDFPKYFSLEAFYRELNAELISSVACPNTVACPGPVLPLGKLVFGNGGFARPYFRAALTYKIRNSEDRFIVASVERSVNTFLIADPTQPDLRSFRENVAQISLVFRLRR